jgi:regulator of sirC expression with transglutaminase-like and TPR domain
LCITFGTPDRLGWKEFQFLRFVTQLQCEVEACTLDSVDGLERWRELVTRADREIPLDEASFVIAAQAEPDLDVAAQLARLDDLAAPLGRSSTEQVCRLVFGTLGFRGDHETYDDPQNSYLNRVLDRRLGIPITLSVLLMEIGRRCGVRLEGVGMPGHFLVRDPDEPDLLIDAFSGGRRLDPAACAQLLQTVVGSEAALQPALLAPVGTRAILARILANLDQSFRRRENRDGARWATRLRAAIPGLPMVEQIAMAESLAGLGCHEEGASLLEELANRPGQTAETSQSLRTRARGLLAPFN